MTMKLYADYVKERIGAELYENPDTGFIVYRIQPPVVEILELYVQPFHRRQANGTWMADCIAKLGKKHGCNLMLVTLCKRAKNWEESLKAFQAYEFKYKHHESGLDYYIKEI